MADAKKPDAVHVPIKPQYIDKTVESEADDGETPDKKRRLTDGAWAKSRWQDRTPHHENLCRVLVDVPENGPMPVCSTMRCRYIHDVAKYLQSKPPDIAAECYIYSLKGHCPRGITCRFGGKHITEGGRNKVDEKVQSKYESSAPKTVSFFTKELEAELRKRTYDFKRSEDVLNSLPKPEVPTWMNPGPIDFTADVDVLEEAEVPKIKEDRLGPCPDEDLFSLHLAEKKRIDWKDKLFLPSIANYGNLPFRRICKEYGADVTFSEPLIASNLLEAAPFDWLLSRRHGTEDLFGCQLFGANPYILTRCAQLIEEQTTADFIDLYYGVPGEPVRFRNKNSMSPTRRGKSVETIVQCMSRVTNLPLTMSWRMGDLDDLAPCLKSCQLSMVSMVARHKETREVEWDIIDNAGMQLNPVPVVACSDVLTCYDYFTSKEQRPDLAGLLIARGALVKPWLFGELKQKQDWDITSSERFEILRRFVHYGLDHWGSDAKGIEVTRRFLLDWQSFLCRYIPLGILEQPPQKLNDKCVRYVGRDDMETLLGSQLQQDWIKISEMLLGPVPENFQFSPKVRHGFWPLES